MPTARTSPAATRREQQRAIETKAAILDAALAEFANLGFDGATTRAIARRAGLNHTLIAHHFGGKERLWKATAEHVFERYRRRLAARQAGLDGVDEPALLRLMLREFILFSAEVPEFHRFMMQANQGDPSRLAWLVDRLLVPRSVAELGLVERARDAGLFPREGEAVHLRYLFIGAATSIFTFAREFERISGHDPFRSDVIERHIDLVLRLFRVVPSDA